jgi:lipopolysaccharide/colanic/teichoic acid biosynthesis glycosyltransferase
MYDSIKRLIDLAIVVPSLLIYLPIFLLISIFIRLDSKGPIIYKQKRIGKNGNHIDLYRFRTMDIDAGSSGKVEWKSKSPLENDLRITKVGSILRKMSLDELPQLINILKGEMSLVGPRAVLPFEAGIFDEEWKRERFKAVPGLTGLWQVNAKRLNMEEMIKMDSEYIKKRSIILDFKIMFKTVAHVVRIKPS